jgi:hypothetical protein
VIDVVEVVRFIDGEREGGEKEKKEKIKNKTCNLDFIK